MTSITSYITKRLNEFRRSLAHINALPQLSLLALIIGTGTGLLIVGFRLAIESPFRLLDMESAENFETLAPSSRVILILGGSLIIGLALRHLSKYQRQMSVGHVIDRLHNHQGSLPVINWVAQFLLAVIAIVSGQSVGREGPAVHIGAGASSQIGRWLRLPNNSMQTVIACGVAAGIAASFDTPLAGVIFAMEVIVMEYTIVGFVPVILASVIGSAIAKSVLGENVVFDTGDSTITSLLELPLIVVGGCVIAVFAGIYIRLNLAAMRFTKLPVLVRTLAAGALTAGASIYVPEIMGLGYDTIQAALSGNLLLVSLLTITAVKLFITPISIGLGIPGGLIGPSLFIGACAGAALSATAQHMFPELDINPTIYILLCMSTMMAAVINAPLAALIAVLELSHNPKIIFPAMLMIVVACLSTRLIFKVRGIFVEQLSISNRDIEMGPAARALRGIGVASIMDTTFISTDETLSLDQAKYALIDQPNWIVFPFEDRAFALKASDLAHFIEHLPEPISALKIPIRLNEVPGRRHMLEPILESASLYEALTAIKKSQCQVLAVKTNSGASKTTSRATQGGAQHDIHGSIQGIVTLDAIQNHYQPKEMSSALG